VDNSQRLRREAPPFRLVEVVRSEPLSPYLRRLTLSGRELDGFDIGQPASSVRLLLPFDDEHLEVPTWRGNEFLLADGQRPTIRTVTPVRFDANTLDLDVEIVLHGPGPLSQWAASAKPGDRLAVSGTGRGYEIDETALSFLIAGDESAIPAIRTITPALPEAADVHVTIEVRDGKGIVELPTRPNLAIGWREQGADAPGDQLLRSIRETNPDPTTQYWVAGEAAAVQRIRKYLFDDKLVDRSAAVVRGYWKLNRSSGPTNPAHGG